MNPASFNYAKMGDRQKKSDLQFADRYGADDRI